MGDEPLHPHVRRQRGAQGVGVGPAGRGHHQEIVTGQGLDGRPEQATRVGVVQRALGDVDHRSSRGQLVPPGGPVEPGGGRRQNRPDEPHRRREVGARVLEPSDGRLEVGIGHLGGQVDEEPGEGGRTGLGQAALRQLLNVAQDHVLGDPVQGGVAQVEQRGRPRLQRQRRTGRCRGWSPPAATPRCRPRPGGGAGAVAPRGTHRRTWCRRRSRRRGTRAGWRRARRTARVRGPGRSPAGPPSPRAAPAATWPPGRGWPPSDRGRRTRAPAGRTVPRSPSPCRGSARW